MKHIVESGKPGKLGEFHFAKFVSTLYTILEGCHMVFVIEVLVETHSIQCTKCQKWVHRK